MEDIVNLKYGQEVSRIKREKTKKENKIFKIIKKNIFISAVFVSFLVLSMFNLYLIYSFMKILENI